MRDCILPILHISSHWTEKSTNTKSATEHFSEVKKHAQWYWLLDPDGSCLLTYNQVITGCVHKGVMDPSPV